MIVPGLCSVTFRDRSTDWIMDLAVEAGLRAVEWGADVHAPPGDTATAASIARSCAGVGLACPSYGSYWFAGASSMDDLDRVLESARALGAPTVRIWCRWGLEAGGPDSERARVVEALTDATERATAAGLVLALEFHPGTLTLTAASTVQLLAEVNSPSLGTYWQPLPGAAPEDALAEFRLVRPWLAHVHVFWWDRDDRRLPLREGEALWVPALAELDGERCAYLEFVADDDADCLLADASTLRSWLA